VSKVDEAFHEVYANVPKNVKKTGKTGMAKRKMMTAIALSKARQAGARIPMKGGNTTLAPGSMKAEAIMGRKDNLVQKAKFQTGNICER
jgi:hypothetical protein